MNKKSLLLTLILIALLVTAGIFWCIEKRHVAVNQSVVDPVIEAPIQTETKEDFSPQHIVAIPDSKQVWYEIPETGIRLLLSKEVAEELVYRYYVVNGFVTVNPVTGEEGVSKEIKTTIFSLKKIIDYNQQCDTGLCRTEEMLFAIAKVPGVYHSEPLAFGSKFLKQFKGFYLITGGSQQAVPFANDDEEKKFNDVVGRFLPKIPRLQDIHIRLLEVK